MAHSLKTQGMIELDALRRRARRQLALKRIRPDDCQHIVDALDALEAFIVQMYERETVSHT